MADIELTITAKSDHVQRIMDAFNGYADTPLKITADKNNMFQIFNWDYDEKGSDTNKQFAERIIKEFLRAFVRCYELGLDTERYNTDVSNVTPPSQTVPDEIVE